MAIGAQFWGPPHNHHKVSVATDPVAVLGAVETSVKSNLAKGLIAILSPMFPHQVFLSVGDLDFTWFLGPTSVSPQTASRSIQLFSHSSSVYTAPTDRQTHRHLCDICSNRPHLCTKCRRCGLIINALNNSIMVCSMPQ